MYWAYIFFTINDIIHFILPSLTHKICTQSRHGECKPMLMTVKWNEIGVFCGSPCRSSSMLTLLLYAL